MKSQDHPLIHKLREKLLSILPRLEKKFDKHFQKLMEAIREVADCDACSLWRINVPEHHDEQRECFVSLIERTPRNDALEQDTNEKKRYILKCAESFSATVLSNLKETRKPYYFCSGEQSIKDMCPDFVEGHEIEHLVGIPVKNEEEETIAILTLSFKNNPNNVLLDETNDLLKMFSEIVSPYLAFIIQSSFDRDRQIHWLNWFTHEARGPTQAILFDIQRIIKYKDKIFDFKDSDFSREKLFMHFAAIEKAAAILRHLLLYPRIPNRAHRYTGSDGKTSDGDLLQESKRIVRVMAQSQKPKILWIDDEFADEMNVLVEYVAELEGEFEIDKATSSDEALEKLERETEGFACIILDAMMPLGKKLPLLSPPRFPIAGNHTGVILSVDIRKMEKLRHIPIVMLTNVPIPELTATQKSVDKWCVKAEISAKIFSKIIRKMIASKKK